MNNYFKYAVIDPVSAKILSVSGYMPNIPEGLIVHETNEVEAALLRNANGIFDVTTSTIVAKTMSLKDVEDVLNAKVTSLLDIFAKSRGYDNIIAIASYATSSVEKFAIEAQIAIEARDALWVKTHELLENLDKVNLPSVDSLVEQLPTPTWPA